MRWAGIDPGLTGGIAIMDVPGGKPTKGIMMPLAGKKPDVRAIVHGLNQHGVKVVGIEKQQVMPKQGVASSGVTMGNYGYILGALVIAGFEVHEFRSQEWKKHSLAGTKKDKAAAIEAVTMRYPEVELAPGKKRTPQDGIADAVLIAEHVRRLTIGG